MSLLFPFLGGRGTLVSYMYYNAMYVNFFSYCLYFDFNYVRLIVCRTSHSLHHIKFATYKMHQRL